VESLLGPTGVTFEVLRARLVNQVKRRIDNGEFTERGLSRILGISQSQTHNVLKGARTLQTSLADRILTKLGLSAMDLLSEVELNAALGLLKMVEWDRQMAAAEQGGFEDFALGSLVAPKKPAARSRANKHGERRKAG
jgi:predicted XRE-type DNA-binding protein